MHTHLLSLSHRKPGDSRRPIVTEVRLTDRDGNGVAVDLDEHQLARLMSGSVVEVTTEAVS